MVPILSTLQLAATTYGSNKDGVWCSWRVRNRKTAQATNSKATARWIVHQHPRRALCYLFRMSLHQSWSCSVTAENFVHLCMALWCKITFMFQYPVWKYQFSSFYFLNSALVRIQLQLNLFLRTTVALCCSWKIIHTGYRTVKTVP